jgi:hypothetical protein
MAIFDPSFLDLRRRESDTGGVETTRGNQTGVRRMTSFKDYYRELFQTFGYPLSDRTALSSEVLAEAEARLGVRVPAALRDYYFVAGCERRFNLCCHRLLPPSEWAIDKQRLVFMEENQSVCYWGVSIRNSDSDDPPVSEGVADETTTWHPAHRKCSVFLAAMLHHQAVSGGLPHCFCDSIDISDISKIKFNKDEWRCYGELKGENLFSRPNQVFCFSQVDLPFRQGWMISAGGKTKRDLKAIGAELGVSVK